MITSMTGFASAQGEFGPWSWSWDLRGVNGKGLDLRLRVPDWLDGLEAALRSELAKALGRGNVTVSLRLSRAEAAGRIALNPVALSSVLDALATVEAEAEARGLVIGSATAGDLLALRGLLEPASEDGDTQPLTEAVRADFGPVLDAFVEMRRSEGAALQQVIERQIDEIAGLTDQAAEILEARRDHVTETMRNNLARVMDGAAGADPDRVAQELALIAVKADVTEELDRLRAHVAAARALVATGGAVGRKLDFLMQEFNREANTLCSKSQFTELTTVGLDLKAVIDQMREQVQNVE